MVISARHAKVEEAHATASVQRFHRGSSWNSGLLTTLSNPKAVVFFSSIFAIYMPTMLPIWTQVAMIVLLVSFVAGWYLVVACRIKRRNKSGICSQSARSKAPELSAAISRLDLE